MDEQTWLARMAAAEKTLYHIACGMLVSEPDRQDAMCETAMRCWEHRRELREEKYFTTWSARILINVCRTMYRKKRFFTLWSDNAPEQASEDDHTRLEVQSALEALPAKYRVVLVMQYLEGFTIQEMADILRIPAGTVKYRLHQARKLLRLELDNGREE